MEVGRRTGEGVLQERDHRRRRERPVDPRTSGGRGEVGVVVADVDVRTYLVGVGVSQKVGPTLVTSLTFVGVVGWLPRTSEA